MAQEHSGSNALPDTIWCETHPTYCTTASITKVEHLSLTCHIIELYKHITLYDLTRKLGAFDGWHHRHSVLNRKPPVLKYSATQQSLPGASIWQIKNRNKKFKNLCHDKATIIFAVFRNNHSPWWWYPYFRRVWRCLYHCYDSFNYIRYGVVVLSVSHHEIIVRSPTKRDITCLSWGDGKHNSHKAAYSYQLKKTTDGVQNRSAIGPYFMTQ